MSTNVASLDLCKKLFALSMWDETHAQYYRVYNRQTETHSDAEVLSDAEFAEATGVSTSICPAYDLGYLLRMLPKNVTEFWGKLYPASPCLMYSGTQWVIFYQSTMTGEHNTDELFGQFADAPEDAACLLAIELFEQGILEPEQGAE